MEIVCKQEGRSDIFVAVFMIGYIRNSLRILQCPKTANVYLVWHWTVTMKLHLWIPDIETHRQGFAWCSGELNYIIYVMNRSHQLMLDLHSVVIVGWGATPQRSQLQVLIRPFISFSFVFNLPHLSSLTIVLGLTRPLTNDYQECSVGWNCGQRVRHTTSPPSVNRLPRLWEPPCLTTL
jgi:hypothetical protein